jgi:hypothetical protein
VEEAAETVERRVRAALQSAGDGPG